ncbi:MAG TPA: serine kinase [Pseudolabrys sp.]|nr:serine kinase [Pseudolabrys sp.]
MEAHGILRFSKLVGDDRVHVEACSGRLLVRPAKELAGMIEVHGLGIRHLDFEPLAAVGLIIDLAASDADRSPSTQQAKTTVNGVTLPRLAVAEGRLALPLILGFLRTRPIDLQ